jgi:hypothetical protein
MKLESDLKPRIFYIHGCHKYGEGLLYIANPSFWHIQ